MKTTTSVRIGFVLILIFTLASCQGKFMSDQVRVVVEEKRIALQSEGTASGSWQGKSDLAVNYTTTRNQDTLQIAGDIVFRREKLLDTFRFRLVLIDANGNVLDIKPVASAGGRQEVEQVPFSQEMILPPGTRSFAFSYDGTTRGVGQGGSPNSFWSTPW